jgi:hypothetical protein
VRFLGSKVERMIFYLKLIDVYENKNLSKLMTLTKLIAGKLSYALFGEEFNPS